MAMKVVTIFVKSFQAQTNGLDFMPYRSAPAHR